MSYLFLLIEVPLVESTIQHKRKNQFPSLRGSVAGTLIDTEPSLKSAELVKA
jgi:hypothetical protein